jgi:hypothetical protein
MSGRGKGSEREALLGVGRVAIVAVALVLVATPRAFAQPGDVAPQPPVEPPAETPPPEPEAPAPLPPAPEPVVTQPVVTQPVAPPPPAPPPGWQYPAQPGYSAPAEQAFDPRFVLGLRLGLLLTGSLGQESDCTDSGGLEGTCGPAAGQDADDVSPFGIGLDVLYWSSSALRFGGSVFFVPSSEAEAGSQSNGYGSDLTTVGVLEGAFGEGSVRMILRGEAGLFTLFYGGEALKGRQQACVEARSLGITECSIGEGPFLGWTIGAGGGILGITRSVQLRLELMFQHYALPSAGRSRIAGDTGTGPGSAESELRISGNRLWLIAGLEI